MRLSSDVFGFTQWPFVFELFLHYLLRQLQDENKELFSKELNLYKLFLRP